MRAPALLIAALASPTLAGPVVERLPDGDIDWTRESLIVEAFSERRPGFSDLKTIEQDARAVLAPRMEAAARAVRVAGAIDAGEVMDGAGPVAEVVSDNLLRWRVIETRYYSSGRVELRAELALQPWLSPTALEIARGREDLSLQTNNTGVVIDARATALRPSFAPRVLGPAGEVIYSAASLSSDTAARLAPAAWVTDPSDEAAIQRAGANPLFILAHDVQDACDIALEPRDAALLKVLQEESALLAQARIVIIVSTP